MKHVPIEIIGCPEWGALEPRNGFESIVWTPGRAVRFIIHHTAGHHAEITNPVDESRLEAIRYARDIQHFHMAPPPRGNGWNDSGHNFLTCRNGIVLQGRWRTIRAIQQKRMVVSAHCPNQNDQVGIEFEHISGEQMTKKQFEAGAHLMAWVCAQYGLNKILPADPHKKYFATACPDVLAAKIKPMRERAQQILNAA